ncbi:Ferredoxin subunit of nitrite reductase or a ring-hydroxylating dioxygenase [Halogranum gelatinilyticum]|uniref:Ferredoxin subunit of nitrite reductase or a ring-hydroxylating dioxygenase n=1 Tax=Halogranum gelatinilyticum TaxID=660521 RepID=A0A1G9QJR2_9EURY|nr:Rieske 2Fe-2S domain-containing protein [Halogranum gelatinilyticum]SDM11243.1 Ferredoxin subunit of nitrite reductase or a ring-hydroxylating dioxygenase [Halogranum gelatinilyticum]
MDSDRRIASVDEIPDESTFLFTVNETETQEDREAILVHTDGDVAAWLNYCQHYTHIKLDKGSGAPMRDGEVVCANHGAYFDCESGLCTFGPCEGAYLNGLDIAVDDGAVYLTDDDYAFVGAGAPKSDPADLSSKSNMEF